MVSMMHQIMNNAMMATIFLVTAAQVTAPSRLASSASTMLPNPASATQTAATASETPRRLPSSAMTATTWTSTAVLARDRSRPTMRAHQARQPTPERQFTSRLS